MLGQSQSTCQLIPKCEDNYYKKKISEDRSTSRTLYQCTFNLRGTQNVVGKTPVVREIHSGGLRAGIYSTLKYTYFNDDI